MVALPFLYPLEHLVLVGSRYQRQPGFLQVYLADAVDELNRHQPAVHRRSLMVLSVAVIHSDDPDSVSFLHDDLD